MKKNSLSSNMYKIPIGLTFFIIAIVAAMKLICEFLRGSRRVFWRSSDLGSGGAVIFFPFSATHSGVVLVKYAMFKNC